MKVRMLQWSGHVVVAVVVILLMAMSAGAQAQGWPRAGWSASQEAEGQGTVFLGKGRSRNPDERAALEEAVIAAKADALEKATERLLIQVKDENLRAIAARYIYEKVRPDDVFARVEVTSKRRTKTTTYVTLKVALNDKLPKTISMLRERFKMRGYPLLMVVLDEEIIQPKTRPPVTPGMTAQIAIEQLFVKAGLTVVDNRQVTKNERMAIKAAVIEGNHEAVVRLARKHKANVVLSGPMAKAQYLGNVNIGAVAGAWPRYGATVQVRPIDSDIGQLLTAKDCEGRGVGETDLFAVRNAFKDAGTKIAKELLKEIFWFWFGPDDFVVRVSVRGLDHDKVVEIADSIVEEENWAKRQGSVGLQEGECTFTLTVTEPGTSAKVADVIRQIEKKLKVTEVTTRRVVLEKKD